MYLRGYAAAILRRADSYVDMWTAAIKTHRVACLFAWRAGEDEPAPLVVPQAIRDELEKRAKQRSRTASQFHRGGSTSGGPGKPPGLT